MVSAGKVPQDGFVRIHDVLDVWLMLKNKTYSTYVRTLPTSGAGISKASAVFVVFFPRGIFTFISA